MSELVGEGCCLAGVGRECHTPLMVLGSKMVVVVIEMKTMVGMVMFGRR